MRNVFPESDEFFSNVPSEKETAASAGDFDSGLEHIFGELKKLAAAARVFQKHESEAGDGKNPAPLSLQLLEAQEHLLQFYRERNHAESADSESIFEDVFQKIENIAREAADLHAQVREASERETVTAFRQQLVSVRFELLQLQRKFAAAPVAYPPQDALAGAPPQEFATASVFLPAPPPPPAAKTVGVARVAAPPLFLPETPLPKPKKVVRWLRNFGIDGFGVSLLVHVVLVLVALFWVVARYVVPETVTPVTFVTGAGGGEKGDSPRDFSHKAPLKKFQPPNANRPRITAKSVSGTALPEMPPLGLSALQSTLGTGELSKGLGGGAGGGMGTGVGPGIGDGRNMVGKMVMGVRMKAKKIAVYLDNSGSMVPYLENVKKEIYAAYPDADIFEIKSIGITVRNGKVFGGRQYSPPPPKAGKRGAAAKKAASAAWEKTLSALSPAGQKSTRSRDAILHKWGANFRLKSASAGAWLDIMMFEKYDALVVFSDFQDGVTQRAGGVSIFVEKRGRPTDDRSAAEKKWEEEWLARFSDKKNGPRLYLFSIQMRPQTIWQKCVEASGGAIKMMPELREKSSSVTKENDRTQRKK